MTPDRPYSRGDYNRALIVNALTVPFHVILLAAALIVGLLVEAFVPVALIGLAVYAVAALRTYFDEDEATKVLERERAKRRKELQRPAVDLRRLTSTIAGTVQRAHDRRARINEAIDSAQLPYEEVATEVDRFVAAIEHTALRAQLLFEALSDNPPHVVAQRLQQVQGDPGRADLAHALGEQLAVHQRMEAQLQRFYDQMERLLVELDTVRAHLVSMSASTDAANQQELAADVRGLNEEVGALAAGMSEAYEGGSDPLSAND